MSGPGQIGRLLILFGLLLIADGGIVLVLGRFGFFKLPGDLDFGGKSWRVFIPLTSCIILSLLLTILFWVISYFRR